MDPTCLDVTMAGKSGTEWKKNQNQLCSKRKKNCNLLYIRESHSFGTKYKYQIQKLSFNDFPYKIILIYS